MLDISSERPDLTLMLLGPGECVEFRRKVVEDLREQGLSVLIMEDDIETKHEIRLDVKLQKIMGRKEPLFIAFFLQEAESMEGVIFEIGCICCKYADSIRDRLMLLSNKGYDWSTRTPYMDNLIPRITTDYFDEGSEFHRASQRILNFADGYAISHPTK